MHRFHLFFYNLRCVFHRFNKDRCLSRASELTFTTLLALVPMMMVGLAIFTAFPQFAVLGERAQDFIFTNFVPSTGHIIQDQLNLWVHKTVQLSWIGIVSLLLTAIFVLFSIESAFNAIWRVKKSRGFIEAFFLYWGLLSLAPIALGACVWMVSYFFDISLLKSSVSSEFVRKMVWSGIIFVLTALWFTILYRVLPNRPSPRRYCFMAGGVSAVLFELARQGFAFYMARFSIYTFVYGALASIPIFLLWLYLSWVIILFGAELLQVLPYWPVVVEKRRQCPLSRALSLLHILQEHSGSYPYARWLRQAPPDDLAQMYSINTEELEERLEHAGFIALVRGKLKLSVDLQSLSLASLMAAIYVPNVDWDQEISDNPALQVKLQEGAIAMRDIWQIPVSSFLETRPEQ